MTASLTTLKPLNLTTTDSYTFANVSATGNVVGGNISVTGNISAGNVAVTGNVTTNGAPLATTGKAIAMAIVFGF